MHRATRELIDTVTATNAAARYRDTIRQEKATILMSRGATRVVGYIRVSSEDQVRDGVSLEAQEARIVAFCQAKGWQLVRVVRDEGKSAKDVKRQGLQDILAALSKKSRGWDGLVVAKLDRLTRSVRDLGNLTDAFKRAHVGLTSIQENVDTAGASDELFFNLVASVSQWERRAVGERTEGAMAHLRSQGRRVSRHAPFGHRFKNTGKKNGQARPSTKSFRNPRSRTFGAPSCNSLSGGRCGAFPPSWPVAGTGVGLAGRSTRLVFTVLFPMGPLDRKGLVARRGFLPTPL